MDFTCGSATSQETLTLLSGYQNTDVTDDLSNGAYYVEPNDDSITINCGNPPTATPTPTRTPGGPTDTPTPIPSDTPTPVATPTPQFSAFTPTRTPRRNHALLGDVDGNLTVDAIDALWVLWLDAGIVVDVPVPDAADMDGNDVVNSTDALYILWVDAGELSLF